MEASDLIVVSFSPELKSNFNFFFALHLPQRLFSPWVKFLNPGSLQFFVE